MPPVPINPTRITGPWTDGYVLDRHTISSTPTGDPIYRFDTKRTELGELLYQFKYGGKPQPGAYDPFAPHPVPSALQGPMDSAKIDLMQGIVDTVHDFLEKRCATWPSFDCIVPAPPSLKREVQPVVAIARELAARLGLPLCENAVVKAKPTSQMKNVDKADRPRVLSEAIQKGPADVRGKRVLLVDDLIESGATLRRATEVLLRDGSAAAVYALVLTRTK